MNDQRRTKADLIEELQATRGRVVELENSLAGRLTGGRAAEEQTHYRLVWETASDNITWHDTSEGLAFLAANPAVLASLGYTEEELIGASALDLVHPDDRQAATQSIAEATAEGRSAVELRIRRKDGAYSWFEIAGHYGPGGESDDKLLCISRDITARKETEQALRLYEMAVEGSPDLVVAIDRSYSYILANQAFLDYHRVSREEALGHPAAEVVGEELFARFKPHCDRAFRGERVEYDLVHGTAGVNQRFDHVSYWPLRSDDGEILGLVAIIRDITSEKELDRQRDVTVGLLELLNARVEDDDLLGRVTALLEDYSGCAAIGIRLREEDRFPFCKVRGLPVDPLGADAVRPGTGCACSRVLAGLRTGAPGCWTNHGGFWTNALGRLPATGQEAVNCRLAREQGYESMAVLPVRARSETIGLLHLYDRRPGMFDAPKVAFLERFAGSLAIGLAHRRTLQTLRERETHLSTILKNARDLIYATESTRGSFTYVSPSSESILGFTPEEVLAMGTDGYEERVHPDNRGMHRAATGRMTRAQDGGRREPPLDYRFLHKDGTYRWLSASRTLLRDESARTTTIVGLVRDMTGRRRGEEALRQSEARYRLLIENAGVPIFIINSEGVYEAINGFGARILGGEPEDLIGLNIRDVFPEEEARRQMADVHKAIDSLDVLTVEPRMVIQGQEYWLRVRITPIIEEEDRPRRVLVVVHDITDLKHAEQDLLTYQQHLRTLASELAFAEERERRQIAAGLHDQIGQALTIAAMKVSLLRKQAGTDAAGEDLQEVAGLIDRALQASRSLTFELSPPVLYDLGLEAALEWLAEHVQERARPGGHLHGRRAAQGARQRRLHHALQGDARAAIQRGQACARRAGAGLPQPARRGRGGGHPGRRGGLLPAGPAPTPPGEGLRPVQHPRTHSAPRRGHVHRVLARTRHQRHPAGAAAKRRGRSVRCSPQGRRTRDGHTRPAGGRPPDHAGGTARPAGRRDRASSWSARPATGARRWTLTERAWAGRGRHGRGHAGHERHGGGAPHRGRPAARARGGPLDARGQALCAPDAAGRRQRLPAQGLHLRRAGAGHPHRGRRQHLPEPRDRPHRGGGLQRAPHELRRGAPRPP